MRVRNLLRKEASEDRGFSGYHGKNSESVSTMRIA
jgi:hypothetical protein